MTSEESIIVPGTLAGTGLEAWRLAWPTIVAQLATTVMWTVDTALLAGTLAGADHLICSGPHFLRPWRDIAQ